MPQHVYCCSEEERKRSGMFGHQQIGVVTCGTETWVDIGLVQTNLEKFTSTDCRKHSASERFPWQLLRLLRSSTCSFSVCGSSWVNWLRQNVHQTSQSFNKALSHCHEAEVAGMWANQMRLYWVIQSQLCVKHLHINYLSDNRLCIIQARTPESFDPSAPAPNKHFPTIFYEFVVDEGSPEDLMRRIFLNCFWWLFNCGWSDLQEFSSLGKLSLNEALRWR